MTSPHLSAEQREALELLASDPQGATEELLVLAHGFDGDMIASSTAGWRRQGGCPYASIKAALGNGCGLFVLPLGLLLSESIIQNERQPRAGLAQLLGNVVSGGRDVLVCQLVGITCRGLGKPPIGIGFGDLERLDSPIGR